MIFTSATIGNLPQLTGIYIFKNEFKIVLYIGKAKNLKKRVSSYFQGTSKREIKTVKMVSQIASIEIITTQSEFEALLLEAKLINYYQPKYNIIWKDDKHYIYIKITNEEFPRILLSRKENDPQSRYFGPFSSAKVIKNILSFARTIFPYCTQSPAVKTPCFYSHLGLCHPCPAEIRKKERAEYLKGKKNYLKNIKQIIKLLNGYLPKVKKSIEKEMLLLARKQEYEKASKLRDKLKNLENLNDCCQTADNYLINPLLSEQKWYKEQLDLLQILKKFYPELKNVKKIECYDVANISGKMATGSMITFINNQPSKNLYRRFRIRTKNTPDDYAMLKEIMERRLTHSEWTLPDLLVIDGGKPQLLAMQKILEKYRISIPIIGLAKKEEELVVASKNSFRKIKLSSSSPALHLIQRLRDEAHRFAHKYHELLRLKYLFSSGNFQNKI